MDNYFVQIQSFVRKQLEIMDQDVAGLAPFSSIVAFDDSQYG